MFSISLSLVSWCLRSFSLIFSAVFPFFHRSSHHPVLDFHSDGLVVLGLSDGSVRDDGSAEYERDAIMAALSKPGSAITRYVAFNDLPPASKLDCARFG